MIYARSKSRLLNLEVGYYGNEPSISGLLTYFDKMGFVRKKSFQNTLTKNTYLQNRIESLFKKRVHGWLFCIYQLLYLAP